MDGTREHHDAVESHSMSPVKGEGLLNYVGQESGRGASSTFGSVKLTEFGRNEGAPAEILRSSFDRQVSDFSPRIHCYPADLKRFMIRSLRRLMGVFGAIVQPLVLATFDTRNDPASSGAVGSKVVCHRDAWSALLAQQLPQDPLRRRSITAALLENIEDETNLIEGSPQPVLLAGDGDRNFVEMPCVAELRRKSTNAAGEAPSEFLVQVANGLENDDDS